MLNKKMLGVAVMVLGAALAGCSSSGKKTQTSPRAQDSVDTTTAPYSDSITGSTAQIGAGAAAADAAVAAERSLTTNVIYFEFDMSEVQPEYQPIVDNYARYLTANPAAKVQLEGHADERGTREYNVGLGERRANAVESALVARGVSRSQLSLLSYGEERPADPGHGEDAWAKNRRVQIIRQ